MKRNNTRAERRKGAMAKVFALALLLFLPAGSLVEAQFEPVRPVDPAPIAPPVMPPIQPIQPIQPVPAQPVPAQPAPQPSNPNNN